MASASRNAIIVQPEASHAALLRAALTSQGANVSSVAPDEHLKASLLRICSLHGGDALLILDLACLASARLTAAAFAKWKRTMLPAVTVVFTCADRPLVADAERTWARAHGALDLLPGASAARWRETLLPSLRVFADALGIATVDPARLELFVRVLLKDAASTTTADVHARIAMIERLGTGLDAILRDMRGAGGVEVKDRSYRMTAYPECFVGSEAVDWMVARLGLTRELAVLAGQAMLESGSLYHVVREQPFQDGNFFYRFAARTRTLEKIDLDTLVARWRGPGGAGVEDRTFRGKTYPLCCVGTEAVKWMRDAYSLTLNEALTLGQRLVDLHILHHVVDEHDFRDGNFFYRFYEDEALALAG